jgi:hypothetical protein
VLGNSEFALEKLLASCPKMSLHYKIVDYSEGKNSWERRNILYSMDLDTFATYRPTHPCIDRPNSME